MGLKQNMSLAAQSPLRFIAADGGAVGTAMSTTKPFFGKTEIRNIWTGSGLSTNTSSNTSSVPTGHIHPSSWNMAFKGGGMSAFVYVGMNTTTSLAYTPPTQANIIGQTNATMIIVTTISANGFITGSVTPFSNLSPQSLAQAVWTADTSLYTTSGTTGKHLNSIKGSTDLIPALL
jgi:hypothetical protein